LAEGGIEKFVKVGGFAFPGFKNRSVIENDYDRRLQKPFLCIA
jgi:hypothetical protein